MQHPDRGPGRDEAQPDRVGLAQQLEAQAGGLVARIRRHHSQRRRCQDGPARAQGDPEVPRVRGQGPGKH